MTSKQRISAIRLIEKAKKYKQYADSVGISATIAVKHTQRIKQR